MITCCRYCADRTLGCHGTCESYLKEKETHNKNQQELRNKKAERNLYSAYARDNHDRIMRYIKRHS